MAVERERAKRWPPRLPFRRGLLEAVPLPEPVPEPERPNATCASCGNGFAYQPSDGARRAGFDIAHCPCGFSFVVDLGGSLDRRADAISGGIDAIQGLMP